MRVLIIEDEVRLATTLAKGLRRSGFAVDVAHDGDSGLEKAMVIDYDVVVLDRDLPIRHGDDVCRRLRADGTRSGILMLTASVTIEDRVSGLALGADDYLPKPFAFAELEARVHALSRRAAPSSLALSMGAHKHQERSDSTMICPLAKPQGRRRSFVDEVRRRVLARRTGNSRDSSARFARTAFPLLKSTRRAGGGARTGLFHDERATRARDGCTSRSCLRSGTPRGTHDYICVLPAMTRILARWRYPELRSFSSVG